MANTKQITPERHLQLTFTKGWDFTTRRPDQRFAKPGETQVAAIKRFMTAIKRAKGLGNRGSTMSCFPRFYPGMTTREYILCALGTEGSKHLDLARLGDRVAPVETGEVLFEEVTA